MLKISMPQLTYPSSHNHGSVKNGSLQIVATFQLQPFSTSMIMGERVRAPSTWLFRGGCFKYLEFSPPFFFWGNHDPIWRIAIFFKGVGEKNTPPFGSKKVMFPTGFQHPTIGDSYLMVPQLTTGCSSWPSLKCSWGTWESRINHQLLKNHKKKPLTMKKQKGYHNRMVATTKSFDMKHPPSWIGVVFFQLQEVVAQNEGQYLRSSTFDRCHRGKYRGLGFP